MSLFGPSPTCPNVRVESAIRSKADIARQPYSACDPATPPVASATVRVELVDRVLPRDDFILEPTSPVRRDVYRTRKFSRFFHSEKRRSRYRDDLQDPFFVQHAARAGLIFQRRHRRRLNNRKYLLRHRKHLTILEISCATLLAAIFIQALRVTFPNPQHRRAVLTRRSRTHAHLSAQNNAGQASWSKTLTFISDGHFCSPTSKL